MWYSGTYVFFCGLSTLSAGFVLKMLQIYLNYQEGQKVYEQMEEFAQKIDNKDLLPEEPSQETSEEVPAL